MLRHPLTLITLRSFQLHKMGMELHNWSRERRESYKKKMHDKNKENRPSSVDNMDVDSLELVNFQEPQVGDSSSPQHHSNLTLHFSPQLGSQKRLVCFCVPSALHVVLMRL